MSCYGRRTATLVYSPDLKTPCLKTSSATVEHATECVTFLEDLWIVY